MSHHHTHSTKNYNKAFAIGIALNVVFVVIEGVYGVLASSLALLADAGHNLQGKMAVLDSGLKPIILDAGKATD